MQVELILALVGKGFDFGRLFFVGDFKQSIYRFRGADPESSAICGNGRLAPVNCRYRSTSAASRRFWSLLMRCFPMCHWQVAETRWHTSHFRRIAHKQRRSRRSNFSGLMSLTWRKGKPARATNARRREAEQIAKRIRLMLDRREEIVAEKDAAGDWHPRTVKNGDIAILFRALSDVQHYEEALEALEHRLLPCRRLRLLRSARNPRHGQSAAHDRQSGRPDQPGRRIPQPSFCFGR